MLKGLSNLASLVKQAQQMGGKMHEVSSQLQAKRVKGSSAGGLIEVEANGAGEILRVRIDPSLEDREMVEDLLPAAINQAGEKARELHTEMMQTMTEGLDMPGLSDAIAQMTGQAPGPKEQ